MKIWPCLYLNGHEIDQCPWIEFPFFYVNYSLVQQVIGITYVFAIGHGKRKKQKKKTRIIGHIHFQFMTEPLHAFFHWMVFK